MPSTKMTTIAGMMKELSGAKRRPKPSGGVLGANARKQVARPGSRFYRGGALGRTVRGMGQGKSKWALERQT